MKSNIKLNTYHLVFLVLILFSGCANTNNPTKNIYATPLFPDNMVVQQKRSLPVWRKDDPESEVSVAINVQNEKTHLIKNK